MSSIVWLLKALNRWLGWVVVISILAIALLTVVVRLLLPAVWDYRADIEQYLSERLRTEVTIRDINASWEGKFPRLLLQDVVIADHRSQNIGRIELGQLVLGFNPVSSLLQWQPVLSKVELWSLHTQAKLVSWPHAAKTNTTDATTESSSSDPLATLWLQPHIFFYDTQIDLTLPSGKQMLLQSERFNLENSSHQHHFAGELQITYEQREAAATLRIESDSHLINPDTNFDFYLKLAGIDTPLMDAARELFPVPASLEQLELNSEIWGNWSQGRLTRIFGDVAGGRLQLQTDQPSLAELSIQDLATGFALLQPEKGRYQLQINNFAARINNQPLSLPQLVINRQQNRVESVALSEFNVTEIAAFLENQPFVPEDLRNVLTTIAPSGMIHRLLLQWPLSSSSLAASEAKAEGQIVATAVTDIAVDSTASEAVSTVVDSSQPLAETATPVVSDDQSQDWTQLTLQGDLEEVAFKGAYGAPAMSGVSGLLQLQYGVDGLEGRIDLRSDRLGLHFPDVFDQGWLFSEAEGVTHFSLAQNILHLSSEYVELHKEGINASGRWSLYLPLDSEIQSELTLLIGVKDSDGRLAPELIPDHEIDPGIKAWVAQSIKQGRLNQGGFMLHTGTRSIPSRQSPTVQMFMDIASAEVDYQSGWPAVKAADASLLLRDQGLAISVSRGQMYDSQVEHGWVYLPPGSQDLHIIASIKGDSADIASTLLNSPVLEGGNAELKNWALKGPAQTRLKLKIPLSGGDPDVDVSSAFTALQLVSKVRNLAISQLAGQVNYRNDKGLYAKSLEGMFFGQPLKADIISSGQGAAEKITARLKSAIRLSELKDWTGIEMLALAEGVQTYEADLDICLRSGCSGLTLKSDLQQTKLDLIAPYDKPVGKALPLLLHTDFESPQTVNIRAGDELSAWLQLEGDQLSRANLVLGAADARPSAFAGLKVSGQLKQLNYEQLIGMLERAGIFGDAATNAKGGKSSEQPVMPVQADIEVAALSYDYLQMSNARILLERRRDGWDIGVSGADLNLQVNLPDDSAIAPQLLFASLNLDGLLPADSDQPPALTPDDQPSMPGRLQPGDVPDLDVEIGDLRVKGKHWGQWHFKVRNREQSMYIEDIIAQLPDFNARGDIIWRPGEVSQSALTLKVEAKDLSRTLENVGYEKVLQTEKVTANMQLQWPGAPWEYALASADGALTFDVRNGRLIEAGSGTGLLRVFGILNMNALGRRLKLNFADLFAKGVSFDRMQGDYRIVDGVASTNTPFVMRGPSVDMASSGDIDLVNETVNQQMAVTLPVTDNIPLAAVLLGAPQIAGLAFLLDKLIGDEVKKEIATVTYTMEGDWSDPKVELLLRPDAKQKQDGLK
ncbi:YhdP family protein [Amphritea sp.]|uniref:YhdP family phospholipid transporter n=1 Tax=Amphritea sp. TaxID=1872502 RepID=UPI003A919A86